MRQLKWIAATSLITLGLGGCGLLGGGGTPTADVSPEAASTSIPIPVPTDAPAEAGDPPPGDTIIVEGDAPVVASLPADLISSTDPAQRLQEIQRNRPDPFALVPVTPEILRDEDAPQAGAPGTGAPGIVPPPGQLAPIPELVPNPTPLPPPPPPTDLARAVQVTGVVQIGNIPYAIVNAPNEPSSRYVRVGQLLSNGQVLVKRIELQGVEPVVILEQSGIEIVRMVGEGGPAPTTAPAAAAIFSVPSQPAG
mgnify:CR=1 FL=1